MISVPVYLFAMSQHTRAQPASSPPHDSCRSSSDDDCGERSVVTLAAATATRSGAEQRDNHHHHHQQQQLHAVRDDPKKLSFKTAGKISVELTRRSRRARLAVLARVLRERIDDLEVAAVVCAHLHDR